MGRSRLDSKSLPSEKAVDFPLRLDGPPIQGLGGPDGLKGGKARDGEVGQRPRI